MKFLKFIICFAILLASLSACSTSNKESLFYSNEEDEIHRTTEIAKLKDFDISNLQKITEFTQIDIEDNVLAVSSFNYTNPKELAKIQKELENQVNDGKIKNYQIVYGEQEVVIRKGEVIRAVLTVLITK